MLRRILGGFFEDSGVIVLLIAVVGIGIIYVGDWEVFKEILITFQPIMYGMAWIGMLTLPFLVVKQLWVTVLFNFAFSAGLMYLADIVIASWR